MNSSDAEVRLLKKLLTSQPVTCPKCGSAQLEHLHKKAKKATVTGDVLPAARYTEQSGCSKSCKANKRYRLKREKNRHLFKKICEGMVVK